MSEIFFEFRPILPEDKNLMKVGLTMLSRESIRQRFFTNKKEFSEEELKYFTEVDQIHHLAFVAIAHTDGKEVLAGVIRAVKKTGQETHAEIGVTIADNCQGKGLGTKLLNEIAESALKVGITHFCGDFHTSNLKMTKLLDKFSKSRGNLFLKHTGDGFIYFEAPLKS